MFTEHCDICTVVTRVRTFSSVHFNVLPLTILSFTFLGQPSLMYSSKTNKMQRYTMVFITMMPYMFQAGPPPIIRSSKLYTQHRAFVELELYSTVNYRFYTLVIYCTIQLQLDKYPMLFMQV